MPVRLVVTDMDGTLYSWIDYIVPAVESMVDAVGKATGFPRLKVVSAENDVSWLPHFMYRLDHGYDRLRHFENVKLSLMPSEYIKRQVWATFQFENVWIDTRKRYDMSKIMWSSDYPHTDSPWPRSKEYIAEHFQEALAEDLANVVGGNVIGLYGIS